MYTVTSAIKTPLSAVAPGTTIHEPADSLDLVCCENTRGGRTVLSAHVAAGLAADGGECGVRVDMVCGCVDVWVSVVCGV